MQNSKKAKLGEQLTGNQESCCTMAGWSSVAGVEKEGTEQATLTSSPHLILLAVTLLLQ